MLLSYYMILLYDIILLVFIKVPISILSCHLTQYIYSQSYSNTYQVSKSQQTDTVQCILILRFVDNYAHNSVQIPTFSTGISVNLRHYRWFRLKFFMGLLGIFAIKK